MDGSVPRIAVVGILMALLIACAGAATIQVSVYELAKNATPVLVRIGICEHRPRRKDRIERDAHDHSARDGDIRYKGDKAGV